MKWPDDLSTLLITESGILILEMEVDAEVLGVIELDGRLGFKIARPD